MLRDFAARILTRVGRVPVLLSPDAVEELRVQGTDVPEHGDKLIENCGEDLKSNTISKLASGAVSEGRVRVQASDFKHH